MKLNQIWKNIFQIRIFLLKVRIGVKKLSYLVAQYFGKDFFQKVFL